MNDLVLLLLFLLIEGHFAGALRRKKLSVKRSWKNKERTMAK